MRIPEEVVQEEAWDEGEKSDTCDRFFFLPFVDKKQSADHPQLREDQYEYIMYWLDIPDGYLRMKMHHGQRVISRPDTTKRLSRYDSFRLMKQNRSIRHGTFFSDHATLEARKNRLMENPRKNTA